VVAVMVDTPGLPGAACRRQHEGFDQARGGNGSARRRCVEICAQCPALVACRQWADGLPRRERAAMGVLAGTVPRSKRSEGQPEHAVRPAQQPRGATGMAAPHSKHQRREIEAQRVARRAARLAASKRAS